MRGELWEAREVDGKLKSDLEWPNCTYIIRTVIARARMGVLIL